MGVHFKIHFLDKTVVKSIADEGNKSTIKIYYIIYKKDIYIQYIIISEH